MSILGEKNITDKTNYMYIMLSGVDTAVTL